MKKTITRGHALILSNQMATMPFGYLADDIIEALMNNLVNLNKVASQYSKLMEELSKRLYDGLDQNLLSEYNAKAAKATAEEMQAEYPDLYALVQKQNNIDVSLKNKEVEIEFTPIDKSEFIKGVLKGKPTIAMGVFDIFEPMYKEDKNAKKTEDVADFSELDELMEYV